jgi:hypothetical protein
MSVTSASTFAQLAYFDLPKPTTSDVAAWNTLKSPLPTGYTATTYNVKLGVWGGDLTKFL